MEMKHAQKGWKKLNRDQKQTKIDQSNELNWIIDSSSESKSDPHNFLFMS